MNINVLRTAGAAGLLAAMLAAPSAQASLLTDSTRYYDAGVPGAGTAADYASAWDALTASPASAGYANVLTGSWAWVRNAGGANVHVASFHQAVFTIAEAGLWTFRTSFASGWGGALLVDRIALQSRPTAMRWQGSWADPAQYLQGSLTLSSGTHVLRVYGFDPCCDAPGQGQFAAPGAAGVFRTFTSADGLNAIPEPFAIGLIGIGFAGLGMLRRWRDRR